MGHLVLKRIINYNQCGDPRSSCLHFIKMDKRLMKSWNNLEILTTKIYVLLIPRLLYSEKENFYIVDLITF